MTSTPAADRPDAPVRRHTPLRRTRTGALVAGLLLIAAVAAACGNAAPSPSASGSGHTVGTQGSGEHTTTSSSGGQRPGGNRGTTTTSGPTTYSTTPAPEIKTPTVTINGHVYPVPTNTPGQPISSSTDTGSQIVITDKGVLPYHLFVNIGQPIVWTNLSSAPVRVTLVVYPVTSPLIATGATFSHTFSTSYSFAYNTSNGHQGVVEVGAFAS